MLKCQLCDYEHEFMIAPTHIKKHGFTSAEYKEKFPNAVLRVQTEEAKLKIKNSKTGKENCKLKNRIFSDEHRLKLSNALKNGHKDGSIVHWNIGKHLSEETKQKISEGNKKIINKGNEKQKALKIERMHDGAKLFDCSLLEIKENTAIATCNICNHTFEFTHQIFYPNRLKLSNKLCPVCNPRETFSSQGEQEVLNFIKSTYSGIVISNDREQLGGKEIDIFIPEFNLGIEYTGLYWHAEKQNDKNSHLLWKKQFANKNGINLITIFEDEWILKPEIVKSRILGMLNLTSRKIFARKCEIRLVDNKIKKEFLIDNHIQGNDQPKIALGLFLDNSLVSLMTFKKSNIVKGGDGSKWELSRFCSLLNTTVIGAASKLLKHFVNNYKENLEIISYADQRWSTGALYKTLGFTFAGTSSPSYWYTIDYKIRHHRSKFMKHKIVKLFNEDANKSEWEIMQNNGYDRIWDCGTSKWILK